MLDAARKRPLLYDRKGDQHYDFASAFIKSMRGGDADASVYYLAAMLEAGEDPRFIARRMVILASEDVGNADPNALVVAVAAAQALEHVGLPEAQLNLAQAAIYLARAPKSNALGGRDLGGAPGRPRARERPRRRRCSARPATRQRRRRAGTARATPTRTTTRPASSSRTSRRSFADGGTIGRPERERSRRMAVRTGDSGARVRPRDDATASACGSPTSAAARTSSSSSTPSRSRRSARTRRATCRRTSQSFRDAGTEIVFVSCDPSAARQAWKKRARRRVHLRLRLLAARRGREGVRRLQRGERRAAPRYVPHRPRRHRDLVAREGARRAPDRDGPGLARRARTRPSDARAPRVG